MIKAFVFGKFLPFHKGHEAMIQFALTKCDFLTVLICCSDKENIAGEVRKNWIDKAFDEPQHMEVKCFHYLEAQLPNTSVPSKEISKIWSEIFKDLFPDYNLVITSEEYGNFVATFMGIKHLPFDLQKQLFPVSATNVRNNLNNNWKFLPESVKSHFAIKIVILGTESTGKTTLTTKLATYYNGSMITEAGRDLIINSNSFEFDDLYLVANEQAKRIEQAILGESPLLIIDTDIHITMSYAKFLFGRELELDGGIYQTNKADLYLYLNNDVEYVQDGTRLGEEDRNLLDKSHREILKQHRIPFVEIKGNWQQRFERAVAQVDQLISVSNKHLRTLSHER